ncbi:MAG: uncharacterized membrane protein YgdD (TMEM256/DUF423 family) [Thalassomonas sp.]|jgi:uncharacterized membrane protein YgdD (TMEM256/DUF423 family)
MTTDKFIKTGIFFCLTAVILGAFGAHSLKQVLTEKQLSSFQTGINYQFLHGLVILILSLNATYFTSKLNGILKMMIAGIILFSFSIYLLTIQDILGVSMLFMGPITPIGGLLLISAWIMLFFSIKKQA